MNLPPPCVLDRLPPLEAEVKCTSGKGAFIWVCVRMGFMLLFFKKHVCMFVQYFPQLCALVFSIHCRPTKYCNIHVRTCDIMCFFTMGTSTCTCTQPFIPVHVCNAETWRYTWHKTPKTELNIGMVSIVMQILL